MRCVRTVTERSLAMKKYYRAPEITELRLHSQETQAAAFQRGCGQMCSKPPATKLVVATAKICLRFYDRQQDMVCLLPAETRECESGVNLGFARHFVSTSYNAHQVNVIFFYGRRSKNIQER